MSESRRNRDANEEARLETDEPSTEGGLPEDAGDEDALVGDLDESGSPDQEQIDEKDQETADLKAERRPTQRNRRQAAERERDEYRRRLEDVERQLTERARPQPVDPEAQARADRAEMEHVATLPYEQQSRYWYDKGRREFGQALVNLQIQGNDRADRDGFERIIDRTPTARRFEREVERLVAAERSRGNLSVSRVAVLNFLVGQEALAQLSNSEQQRREGRRQIRRETTRPANSRADVAPQQQERQSTRDRQAYLRRLENYRF